MNDFTLLLASLSLSGTVIAGLCFAVKAIWKKKLSKSVLYYLWLVALVRLVLPFSFEGALLNRIYEGNMKTASSSLSVVSTQTAPAQVAASISTVSKINPVQTAETVSSPATVSVNAPAIASVDAPTITAVNPTTPKPFDFTLLIPYLWLVGFSAFFGYAMISYNLFTAKLKKANRPADKNVLEVGEQLKCKVKIYQNPLAKTPMLIGLFRQIIILPDIQYTEEELKGALAHELTHKRRHDLLYKWFALFVNAVHWFNPVIWLVRREVSRACELSCDEAVIMNLQANEKQSYGETLINLAAAHRYPAGVIATTLCEEKQTLKERLGAIMAYRKKGLLNKVLSCVLILAIAASGTLLGACGTASTSLPNILQPKTGQVSTMNILALNFFSHADSEKTEQYKKNWLEEMSLRYGVKLNITSDTFKDGENDTSVISRISDVLYGKEPFAGLVEVKSMQIASETIDQLLPLDDYLADNPVWKSLPDVLKDAFKVDGHIYAIPANGFRGQYARKITDEALKQTGITVTDLESFRNFAKAYTKSTGKPVLSSNYLEYLTDILNAFGLYNMGYVSNNPFSYDPTEDCCVDFLTKGAAVDALEYIRELYQAGAFDIRFDDSVEVDKDFIDGVTCTFYFQYFDQENCTELFTLNPQYPQFALTSVNGFAMTKDTPQPKETINQFLNMLFGSEDSYLECWLGTSDNYVLNSDGTVTVKMPQNADGSFTYPPMPNLTGGLTDIFPYSNANIFFSENGVVGQGSKTEAGKDNERFAILYDSFKKGLIVDVPSFYQTTIRNGIFTAIDKDHYMDMLYRNCIKNAIISSKYTVQQVVDNYREEMFNNGGNALLDQINAAIGKKTAYYYG